MGAKNYLIEGVSCVGKTSVCNELQRRGYYSIHGDRELAYWGDPETGEPLDSRAYEHWIWDVEKVRALVADKRHAVTFFCGGSRNFYRFIDLLDGVFVLEVDLDTLNRRLALRPKNEWGGRASDGEYNARLQHAMKQGIPENATTIDATAPIEDVVDAILEKCQLRDP
jgi:thymidylate kinase